MNPTQPARIIGLILVAVALLWPIVGDRITAGVSPDREGCAHSRDLFDADGLAKARGAVVCLVNHERMSRGLSPLIPDQLLDSAAQRHALDMGRRNFYAHRDPDGGEPHDRIKRAGFAGRTTGENIHWGVGLNATPAKIVEDWMNSPGHRANILRPSFTRIGTGISDDPPEGLHSDAGVYVNNFGG